MVIFLQGHLRSAPPLPPRIAATLTPIGDTDIFDWGGLLGAVIGTLIVLGLAGYFLRRRQPRQLS